MNSTPLSKVSLVCIHLTVLVGLSVSAAFAQRPTSPASAKEYDRGMALSKQAETLRSKGGRESVQGAIGLYSRALMIFKSVGSGREEAETLDKLGQLHFVLGERQKALEFLLQTLSKYREIGDRKGEAASLNNLSQLHSGNNEFRKALDALYLALPIYEELAQREDAAGVLSGIAALHSILGERQKALEAFTRALPVFKAAGEKFQEASVLGNIGALYIVLGDRRKALGFLEQALAIYREMGFKGAEADTLRKIGLAYSGLGDKKLALDNLNQALAVRKDLQGQMGNKAGEAAILHSIGLTHRAFGENQTALEYFDRALAVFTELRLKGFETSVLADMGAALTDKGENQRAVDFLNRALPDFVDVGFREGEADTLRWLMKAWLGLGNPRLAILYGKQSVNVYQQLRGEISGLGQEIQKTYLTSIEETYRLLAEVLSSEGRFAEAQQVLALLKEEEYASYVSRDADEIKSLSARADLRPEEKAVLEKYNELAGTVTETATHLTRLDAVRRRQGPEFKQQAEYDELKSKLDTANAAFRIFLEKEIAEQFPKNVKREIELDRALQGRLAQWGEGTVALYTILGEDRYRVILTTPKVQVDGKTEIKAADLNKKLFAFREALRDPRIDPKPLGKELYDILIKPIEKQLEGAGAKTLVWSLDGALRYIPIGTLSPDGSSYFAERYRNVVVTSTIRQGLSSPTDGNWRVLGAGVTKQSKVMDPVTGDPVSFSALPGVDLELGRIVLEDDEQPAEGILGGTQLLDDTFDARSLGNLLTQRKADAPAHNVVHLATHFRLGTDNARSFLLVGGGKTLTLAEISDDTNLDFSDIELVTLSACDTAFGTAVENRGGNSVGNGAEVDSLATFIELRGAKAVMASLWPVADESTSLLMTEFYRIKAADPKMTKAEALQRAQLAMISGQLKSVGGKGNCRSDEIDLTGTGPKRFVCNTDAPYSHPYFWSPFVLIGNWR